MASSETDQSLVAGRFVLPIFHRMAVCAIRAVGPSGGFGMKISGLVLLSLFASFTACADLDQLARTEKAIPITFHNSGAQVMDSGAMYLWPPYSSAAVVDKKGNRCILAASGAKTINATSEGAFKLGKALEKIEGLDASVKNTLVESFTKISSADAKAAFVDIALFHLCILEQNGTFKSEDPARRDLVLQAYLATIEAITRSAPDAEAKPISLKAP